MELALFVIAKQCKVQCNVSLFACGQLLYHLLIPTSSIDPFISNSDIHCRLLDFIDVLLTVISLLDLLYCICIMWH